MNLTETISTQPLVAERTLRRNELRVLTSGRAGKVLPLAYVPMLREDRVSRGVMRVRIEMAETVRTLMNAINVTVYAHFVPFLAFERFNGVDQLNRSYKGEPETEGGAVVPFFQDIPYDRNAPLFRVMGLHAKQGEPVNSAVVEAYNAVVNFRRKARSSKLPMRDRLDTTLAAGFWKNTTFRDIVPDFDQAMIDGEVPLNIVSTRLPIQGVAWQNVNPPVGEMKDTITGEDVTEAEYRAAFVKVINNSLPRIYAELADTGVTLSLANIEMAKQTAAFAALRKQYSGIDDDYVIDLLMEAIRVPDAQLQQPILLDRKSTIMGYSRRFATDGANLDQSVTTGETSVDLRVRTPAMNTGGVILVTAEIVPEQLFERAEDHFLSAMTVDQLPHFTRDFLDPEKVAIVRNRHVDVEHSNPDGTFGYAPLNHEWNRALANIGGKFHRQLGDPFVEDRQRLWSVETVDPALTSDFYLVNALHQKVFADTAVDPFEIVALGAMEIVGHTVFGKRLEENTFDYDAVRQEVDTGRVEQEAP